MPFYTLPIKTSTDKFQFTFSHLTPEFYFNFFSILQKADPLLCSENVPSTVKSVSPGDSCTYGTHYPNRIFVGHLPGKTNATDLADFFRTFGTVLEGKVVLDSFGRSRR